MRHESLRVTDKVDDSMIISTISYKTRTDMLAQVESELGPGRRIVNAPPKRRPVQYEVSTCFIRLSFINVEGKGVIEHEKIT